MTSFFVSGKGKNSYHKLIREKQKRFLKALHAQQKKKKFKTATDVITLGEISELFK